MSVPPAWGGQLPAGRSAAYQFGDFCRVALALFGVLGGLGFFFLFFFWAAFTASLQRFEFHHPGFALVGIWGKPRAELCSGGVVLSPPLLVSTAWKDLTVL